MEGPSNLTQRVLVALAFGPVFLVLFWVGGVPLLVGLCIVVAAGTWEFYRMQEHKGLQPWAWLGIAASLAWCVWFHFLGPGSLLFPLLGLVLLVLSVAIVHGGPVFRVADAWATLAGVLYVGFLGSTALLVRNYSHAGVSEGGSPELAVLVLAGIWTADTAAYFCGRAFGRRHPFPNISPGKTGAGCVGSVVGPLLVVMSGTRVLGVLSVAEGVGLGLVVGVGSLVGDLAESMIKRDAGVKDASGIIPGHGGILDRFDSFLFVYPLAYLYLVLLV